jgi:predicted regulator of Ras-like GTPase activity (Roadblock/LC7/MglB family)
VGWAPFLRFACKLADYKFKMHTEELTAKTFQLHRELEQIQSNTGSHCVLLLTTSGHTVEHASNISEQDVSNISALIAANFMATTQLAGLVGNRSPFKSNFYEGSDYGIYCLGINIDFILVVVFEIKIKIGLIRFYIKKAMLNIESLATRDLFSIDFSDNHIDVGGSLSNELDTLFGL